MISHVIFVLIVSISIYFCITLGGGDAFSAAAQLNYY
jgi:hypothetical protein